MMPDSTPWLALDIGGANIKAAHSGGAVRSVRFELWKRPDELAPTLVRIASGLPHAGRIAVTMTAELCDCYPTRARGVHEVLLAVLGGFAEDSVRVWGTDGRFHSVADIMRTPLLAAASNWLATATLLAESVEAGAPALLIDIGSTTSDIIPLAGGRVAARGRTDTERLRHGELVYVGVRRTPLCAVATELPHRGVPTGLAAELFAATHDVYLTLGEIAPDPTDEATADGRPATVEAARDRLARIVCADRDGFSFDDAAELAHAADAALVQRLATAARNACEPTIGRPRSAILAGSGAFLARRVAEQLIEPGGTIRNLAHEWGETASVAACARALLRIAEREGSPS